MSRRLRIGLFGISSAGLTALMLWAVAGLPAFGDYSHRYGTLLKKVAVSERHATNVVTSIVFDYRGFDTMGEEFILFTSVMGVALLLRDVREDAERPGDAVASDALGLVGLAFSAGLLVLGLYVIAHGAITPGGGFQGGVVVAGALALVYLAGSYHGYRQLTPHPALDFVEGTGAGGFVVIGIVSMLLGSAFLHNFGPFGVAGTLASAGTISMLNLATALEVSAAFVLLFTEFLEELADTRAETG